MFNDATVTMTRGIFFEIHKVGNIGISTFLKTENKAELDHISKVAAQRRLQENNRNFTTCSHF